MKGKTKLLYVAAATLALGYGIGKSGFWETSRAFSWASQPLASFTFYGQQQKAGEARLAEFQRKVAKEAEWLASEAVGDRLGRAHRDSVDETIEELLQ